MLLFLKVAIRVGIAQVILQRIALAVQLALGVQLEDVELLVVPVVAGILEAHRVAHLADLPYLELYGLILQRDVGVEILRHRQREYGAVAVAGLYTIFARLAVAAVDTETEQRVVAHTPELLLVGTRLHTGRSKHLLHLVHLHVVTVDILRAMVYLGPYQPIIILLDGLWIQVHHVSDVVREIQVKTLRIRACCRQQ